MNGDQQAPAPPPLGSRLAQPKARPLAARLAQPEARPLAFRHLPVRLTGVEAAGEGLGARHGAPLSKGSPGVLHGSYSYLLQDAWGQVAEAHSVSAGLDYPGVGPEHAWLKDLSLIHI